MKYVFIPMFLLFSFSLFSQQDVSWKQHVKLADELYAKSLYSDAAEHYEAAWRKKTKKKELIAKAADCYYIIRDYKKAAAAFSHIKDERKDFPLGGLRYARSLKQSDKFDEATREFIYFIERYKGEDKAVVDRIVQNEIRGCELGIKFGENSSPEIDVFHLSTQVNSPETEFAPIPFNENVLYYSSTMSNKARIYFTMRDGDGNWAKAGAPKNFPVIENKHFCNGSLSPDGQRFYFTICQSKESWGGLTTRCDINMIKKVGDKWTEPQPLREYINQPMSTSTHPYIVHEGNREIMYFSSNRKGGAGGMDLWYSERDLTVDDIDFSLPVNLGKSINTIGDEITPFYETEESVLYFSSNGQPTIGGQDIFRTSGTRDVWSPPTNLGTPLNSTSDDYYYIKTPNASNGFLSSNRVFGIEKITTTHEDLFEFIINEDQSVAISDSEMKTENDFEKEQSVIAETPVSTIQEEIVESPSEEIPSEILADIIESETNYTDASAIITPPVPTDIIEIKTPEVAVETQTDVAEVEMPIAESSIQIQPKIIEAETPKAVSPPAKKYQNTQIEGSNVRVSGHVLNLNAQPVTKVVLGIYEIIGTGGRKLLKNDFLQDGSFDISLDPEKYYYIEARKDGYSVNSLEVFTSEKIISNKKILIERSRDFDFAAVEENPPINVKVNASPKGESPKKIYTPTITKTEVVTPSTSSSNDYRGATYIARGQSKFDKAEFTTSAPRHTGEYYKIQIKADRSFDQTESKYAALNYLGRYDTEFLQEKKLHRVLIGDYFSLNEAKNVLKTIQANGFKRAFVVKYQDGQRFGMIYR